MPLVKLFARNTLNKNVPLARLQTKLCEICEWGSDGTRFGLGWDYIMLQLVGYLPISRGIFSPNECIGSKQETQKSHSPFSPSLVTHHINQSFGSYICLLQGGTKPSTTKLMLFRCEDWTDESFQEDVYVDIRAYGKPERTREFVLEGMENIQKAFADEGLIANLRLETYEGERYFHVPPPSFEKK